MNFVQNSPIAIGDDGHWDNKLEKHDARAIEPPLCVIGPIQLIAETATKGSRIFGHIIVAEKGMQIVPYGESIFELLFL